MAQKGLLEAIRQNPEDDTPRLVYADWLEERGDPRGEFIRTQCQLEQLPRQAPQRATLEEREADLLAEHEESWLRPVPDSLVHWTFSRGFVSFLALEHSLSVKKVEPFLDRHPLAEVEFRCDDAQLRRLARSPFLERVTSLHLGSDPDTWAEVLTSPHATRLTSLSLGGPAAGDEGLYHLARMPGASRLQTLDLTWLSDSGVARLVTEPALAGVTDLTVAITDNITDAGLATLAAPACADRWTALHLDVLPPGSLARLAHCPRLRRLAFGCPDPIPPAEFVLPPHLTHLEIEGHGIADILPVLARQECLPNLRHLELFQWPESGEFRQKDWRNLGQVLGRLRGPVFRLGMNVPGLGGLSLLTRTPNLERLTRLWLLGVNLSDSELRAFASCDRFTGLRELGFVNPRAPNPLGATAVDLLAGAPALAGLRKLELHEVRLGAEGLRRLLASPHLRRLTNLDVGTTGLDGGAVQALASWPGLGRLRDLCLSGNPILAEDVQPLFHAAALSPLTRVRLGFNEKGDCKLSRQDVTPLQAKLGRRLLM